MKTAKSTFFIAAAIAAGLIVSGSVHADVLSGLTAVAPAPAARAPASTTKTQDIQATAQPVDTSSGQPSQDDSAIVQEHVENSEHALFAPVPNISAQESPSMSTQQIQAYSQALQALFGTSNVSPQYTQPTNADGSFGVGGPLNFQSLSPESIAAPPSAATIASVQNGPCYPNPKDRLKCMVCNIYREAGNQDKAGQIAVGRTVMTRLFSTAYANSNTTTCDIIYAKDQYSWTADPNVRTKPLPTGAALSGLIQSAETALAEGPGPFTNYYAPSGMPGGAPPSWWNQGTCAQTHVQIDSQKFCSVANFKNRSMASVDQAEGLSVGTSNLQEATGSAQ